VKIDIGKAPDANNRAGGRQPDAGENVGACTRRRTPNVPAMTSLWQPGQLLFAGFKGTELPRELAELLAQGRLGGVILFARNIADRGRYGP
jgi:hypothetical protein